MELEWQVRNVVHPGFPLVNLMSLGPINSHSMVKDRAMRDIPEPGELSISLLAAVLVQIHIK